MGGGEPDHPMKAPSDIARQWIECWGNADPATLPLADDFTHTSPLGRIEGRQAYLDMVRPLAAANVASLHVEDIVGDDERACIRYRMDTPNGPVACCDWVSVRDGIITEVQSYYDTRLLPKPDTY